MSTVPSADAKAVVRALEGLTTQVRRLADTRQSDFVLSADALDDDATTRVVPDFTSPIAGNVEVRKPCPYCPPPAMIPRTEMTEHLYSFHALQASADGNDDVMQRMRRDAITHLLGRLDSQVISPGEGQLLRQHVEAEIREGDTARAVARGNLRHVQTIVPALERAEADANHNADVAADAVRRADSAERELRTLRTGLRAAGGDPTQIQNLWAQIRLRNRQWAEAKREVRVVRSELEEEGGDVRLVDEMLATVAAAEERAREAGHERDVIAADLETADRIRAEAQRDRDQHAAVLTEILGRFMHAYNDHGTFTGHKCSPVPDEVFQRWHAVVAPTVERPWWETVAEVRTELEEAQAAIERVRAQATAQRARGVSGSTDHKIGLHDAAVAILAALDGPTETQQPEAPAHNFAAYQAAIARVVLVLREAQEHREQTDPSERQDCVMCGADHLAEIRDAIKGKQPDATKEN